MLRGNQSAIATSKEAAFCGGLSSDLPEGRDVCSYRHAVCVPVKKGGRIHKGTHCAL